jgi:uncharacterized protein YhfF
VLRSAAAQSSDNRNPFFVAQLLLRSAIDRRKTVTADTVAEYYKPYGDGSYAPRDIIEVYDRKQQLRCIIKATKAYTIEFGNIPEEVWRGQAFNSAEEFRERHIRCIPRVELHDHFELVTLHFELVEMIAREVAD